MGQRCGSGFIKRKPTNNESLLCEKDPSRKGNVTSDSYFEPESRRYSRRYSVGGFGPPARVFHCSFLSIFDQALQRARGRTTFASLLRELLR